MQQWMSLIRELISWALSAAFKVSSANSKSILDLNGFHGSEWWFVEFS
jgi:hypothetical protein